VPQRQGRSRTRDARQGTAAPPARSRPSLRRLGSPTMRTSSPASAASPTAIVLPRGGDFATDKLEDVLSADHRDGRPAARKVCRRGLDAPRGDFVTPEYWNAQSPPSPNPSGRRCA
jgi:hypothetical protein